LILSLVQTEHYRPGVLTSGYMIRQVADEAMLLLQIWLAIKRSKFSQLFRVLSWI
jgi:hypothetical protein